jgi:hypothetical protein
MSMRSGIWIGTDARPPIDQAIPLPVVVVELEDEIGRKCKQAQDKELDGDVHETSQRKGVPGPFP